MTRGEAIKVLQGEVWINCQEKWFEALNMAIKALEQEPCEVSEYDSDHIWYKGGQYISLRRFLEVKAEAEQEPSGETVSLEAFKQVMWERDTAIEQLKELGYDFGQKIEPCEHAISLETVIEWLKAKDIIKMSSQEETARRELKALLPVTLQPCGDAISRDMSLEKMADYVASGYADSVKDFEEYSRIICQLPPVNPQEPSGDLISRQAVIDELNKWDWQELYLPIHFKENIIDVVPSVNPQQKTGHWILGICDNCGYDWGKDAPIASVPNFCPNCGCRMFEIKESKKVNCKSTKCENCINHNYCDYEPQESEGKG